MAFTLFSILLGVSILSIGICAVNEQHIDFEQLIKDADLAMYQAKENGRNRIGVVGDKIFYLL